MSVAELLSPPTGTEQSASVHPLQVAIAVVRRGGDVLIVSPRTEDMRAPTWQFPAGIVKPGLRPETVAVRETLAETGVRCVLERNLGSRIHPATNVLCAYVLCAYVAGEAANVDIAENADVTWVDRQRLTELIPVERIYPPVLEALGLVSFDSCR